MKKINKINLAVFVLFVFLPHIIRILCKDFISGSYLNTIQYISLIMSLLGGIFIFFFDLRAYKKKNILYYSNSLILFAVFGLVAALASAFY